MRIRRMSYRFRAYPTRAQAERLEAWQHTLRDLWNVANEQRMMRMDRNSGPWPTYNRQAADLTELRREFDWHKDVPTDFSQALLRRLDHGWSEFFTKEDVGMPRFKSKNRDWAPMRTNSKKYFRVRRRRVKLPKVGWIRIRAHRPIMGTPKVVSISRDGDHWYISINCEIEEPTPIHPNSSKTIGLDMGITVAIADSDGGFVENPRFGKRSAIKLARAQRRFARKKKGSKHFAKARDRVRRVHRKIRRQRRDWQHKLTHDYTKSHGVIVVEALLIRNMTRSASGTVENPGSNVKAKTGLNRAISDVGWGEIRRQLTYKANRYGGDLIEVSPRNTSRRCRICGHTSAENRTTQALFTCAECGHREHADTHASRNILALVGQTPAKTAGDARGGIRNGDPMKRERVHCA